MKQLLTGLLTTFVFLLQPVFAANSPIGYWQTSDEITGKPNAVIRIFQTGNKLTGQVVKSYVVSGTEDEPICSACGGARHNQPILGMVIMDGLTRSADNPNEWRDGTILDPTNGKTYHCNIQTLQNGAALKVRGYIGIALFGRSQTWMRVKRA